MLNRYQLCFLALFLCFSASYANNFSSAFHERTFIMVKPDGTQRSLIGEIIKRFEAKGLKLVAMKFIHAPRETVASHYQHLNKKMFFEGLLNYMMSGPVVPMVWEGYRAVKYGRELIGTTDPGNSPVGTLRADYCLTGTRTIVHGAHSVNEAKREIDLWFKKCEIVDWKQASYDWINYEDS